ncbi:predicted protein [Streptomyces sp. AA4]|nr:predicted protein [Streptomyces sp. AA4]
MPTGQSDSIGGGLSMLPEFFDKIGHENIVFHHDSRAGLKAIIAVYSTALGPALGGVRFHAYSSAENALSDALRLSQAMAYKNALAGLALGGGKAVIIGDPASDKTDALWRAYGRVVNSLRGSYITAPDSGTTATDMDAIARDCSYVAGRSRENSGTGDPSPATAYGVFRAMVACAEHVWGSPSLAGRRVGVAGVGKVGTALVKRLLQGGASVVVSDISDRAVEAVRRDHPEVDVAVDTEALASADLDVYAPCALGGALDAHAVARLRARVVCGAANNQLAHDSVADDLHAQRVLYAPDYVVNAGGVIHAAQELAGLNREREAAVRVGRIYETTAEILCQAAEDDVPPLKVAQQRADERIRSAETATAAVRG